MMILMIWWWCHLLILMDVPCNLLCNSTTTTTANTTAKPVTTPELRPVTPRNPIMKPTTAAVPAVVVVSSDSASASATATDNIEADTAIDSTSSSSSNANVLFATDADAGTLTLTSSSSSTTTTNATIIILDGPVTNKPTPTKAPIIAPVITKAPTTKEPAPAASAGAGAAQQQPNDDDFLARLQLLLQLNQFECDISPESLVVVDTDDYANPTTRAVLYLQEEFVASQEQAIQLNTQIFDNVVVTTGAYYDRCLLRATY
mmetsp:Transcript_3143/g.3466  ORF Transcript_3143/g.3466 Transcript_3143/m.3466 type:complete len:260 (+) Transcript_3143:735-1514(+)